MIVVSADDDRFVGQRAFAFEHGDHVLHRRFLLDDVRLAVCARQPVNSRLCGARSPSISLSSVAESFPAAAFNTRSIADRWQKKTGILRLPPLSPLHETKASRRRQAASALNACFGRSFDSRRRPDLQNSDRTPASSTICSRSSANLSSAALSSLVFSSRRLDQFQAVIHENHRRRTVLDRIVQLAAEIRVSESLAVAIERALLCPCCCGSFRRMMTALPFTSMFGVVVVCKRLLAAL